MSQRRRVKKHHIAAGDPCSQAEDLWDGPMDAGAVPSVSTCAAAAIDDWRIYQSSQDPENQEVNESLPKKAMISGRVCVSW